MKLCVLGTGYVGLVAGTCFAENGNDVVCVDVNKEKIDRLNKGEVPIYEPGLNEIIARNRKEGRLSFSTDSVSSIKNAEIIFLAIGTPSSVDGSADLALFMKAAETIAENLNGYKIIVNKSTVPVGTAAKVEKLIRSKTTQSFDVVSNPEFLKEGTAVDDFLKPDRVVIGTSKESVYKTMSQLYAPFVRQGNPILWMSNVSAEMTKYAANSFLATKISFMNEIANLCELVGADVDSVRKGIGTDSRIGKRFLFPGIGYGGSCFPKDVQALAKSSADVHYDFKILSAVMEVNADQKTKLIPRIKDYYRGNLKGKVFAMWGLSFKPHTDDIREAPALYNIEELIKAGAIVKAHDPESMENVQRLLGNKIQFTKDLYEAAEGADAIFIATEWPEFRTPDFDKISSLLKSKVIFDGRNLYDLQQMKDLGYTYFSIGRETIYG